MKQKLPVSFKGYFWDCDFRNLDVNKHREFVIQRLLQYGGLKAIFWAKNNFHRTVIQSYLEDAGKKYLDTRSYEFWSKLVKMRKIWG